MTIGVNKFQFYGKIIMLIIVLLLVGSYVYFRPPIKFDKNSQAFEVIFLLLIWVCLTCLLILMTLQLVFLPKGVDINEDEKILSLHFLFSRSVIINYNEMNQYATITVRGKGFSYDGVLVTTKNSKQYALGDFSLDDYQPIKTFLENVKVPCEGDQKFNFVSYFIQYFKD